MSILINNIETIAERLRLEFNVQTRDINHNLTKGIMREDGLKSALRDLIPQKYEFGSGIIVDAHYNRSRQQDFILYDAFSSPSFLKKEKDLILPVESVYACVEIKSCLDSKALEEAALNFESVMKLEINTVNHSYLPVTGNNKIMGCVFAYSTNTSLDSLTKALLRINEDIPVERRLGCVCILDQGNIVNVQRNNLRILHTLPSDATTILIKKNELKQNLYLFYLLLQSHLNHALNFPPDLWRYAIISGDYEDQGIEMPQEAITDDTIIPLLNGFEINGKDYKRFSKMIPFVHKSLVGELTEDDIVRYGLPIADFHNEFMHAHKLMTEMLTAFFQKAKANQENNNDEINSD